MTHADFLRTRVADALGQNGERGAQADAINGDGVSSGVAAKLRRGKFGHAYLDKASSRHNSNSKSTNLDNTGASSTVAPMGGGGDRWQPSIHP
jgi:hypothetical protein